MGRDGIELQEILGRPYGGEDAIEPQNAARFKIELDHAVGWHRNGLESDHGRARGRRTADLATIVKA